MAGQEEAAKLFEDNIRLVAYATRGMVKSDDSFQDACVSFWQYCCRWVEGDRPDCAFSTGAIQSIRWGMSRVYEGTQQGKRNRRRKALREKFDNLKNDFANERVSASSMRESVSEIAAETGLLNLLDEDHVVYLSETSRWTDVETGGIVEFPIENQLIDNDSDFASDLCDKLTYKTLADCHWNLHGYTEGEIIMMRFGLDGEPPKTQEEISRYLGVTKSRVGQIEARALDRLRPLIMKKL